MKVQHTIHEFNAAAAHRIVCVMEDGTVDPGQWAAYDSIAQHHGMFATSEYFTDALPSGIFTCRAVAHRTITG